MHHSGPAMTITDGNQPSGFILIPTPGSRREPKSMLRPAYPRSAIRIHTLIPRHPLNSEISVSSVIATNPLHVPTRLANHVPIFAHDQSSFPLSRSLASLSFEP